MIAQAQLDIATRNVDAARQALAESEAAATSAKLGYESEISGVNTTVARLQAELGEAQSISIKRRLSRLVPVM